MKHTPGPWEINQDVPGEIYINGQELSIAEIHNHQSALGCDPTLGREATANARLIAAAPAMYLELNAVKSWMKSCLLDNQENGLPGRDRYDSVSAAIALAES